MDIAQYISDLLAEHEEVSLEGIGTFVKQKTSAFFDASDGLYFPPSYKINFKAGNPSTSALLINHIITNKRISESSALYFIERFIDNIKSTLDKDSSATVAPLGKLVNTSDGYIFESDSKNESAEFFGLTEIKEAHIITKSSDFVADAATTTVTEHAIVDDDDEFVNDEPRSGGKGIWITLLLLALLAGFIAVAYYYYPQYFKNLIPKETKKVTPKVVKPIIIAADTTAANDSLSFADSIVNQLEKEGLNGSVEKAQDTVKISTNSTTTKADTAKVEPKPKKIYEIIIASFGLKSEAQAFVRSQRKSGIDAAVITDTKKPKFKVSIGSFPTMKAATKEKKRVQQEFNKDAWILTVINNDNQ